MAWQESGGHDNARVMKWKNEVFFFVVAGARGEETTEEQV